LGCGVGTSIDAIPPNPDPPPPGRENLEFPGTSRTCEIPRTLQQLGMVLDVVLRLFALLGGENSLQRL